MKDNRKKEDGGEQLSIFTISRNGNTISEICDSLQCESNTPAWCDRFGDALRNYIVEHNIQKIRTLSLFSGAGGLDIGFNDVGFDIIESVEIESKFCQTLELNSGEGKRFSNSKVNCIDIREYTGTQLGKIDFIIGGPPCQTFSAAGRRANGVLGTTDARGVLFREYVRLLKDLSPVGFLFENVYGIIGAQGGKAWKEILESFSQVGYKLYYRIIDAADYGTPQHRERLIIVGLKKGCFKFPRPTHGPDSLDKEPFYNAETAVTGVELSEEEKKPGIKGRYGALLDNIPPGLNYSFYTEEMGHPNPIFAWRSKFSDFLYKADPNVPVRTIKAQGGAYTGPFHWDNRFFAFSEYKRLQTFPDDYEISGNRQTAIKQIGNSVPPQLARMMALAIRQQVFKTQFPFTLSLLEDCEELSFRKRKRELTAIYQKKAHMAIASLKEKRTVLPDSHSYFCKVTDTFDFIVLSEKESQFRVDVSWNENLDITVTPTVGTQNEVVAIVDITASDGNWILDVKKIHLSVYDNNMIALTAAWKALDHELIINSIKADIVQLNGYYQYAPKMKCSCVKLPDQKYRKVLFSVISGEHVATIVSSETLAKAWGVKVADVVTVAGYLRSLGYEIRNHKTNPQIEEGFWLIPYAFPTLIPQSVQLRKKVN